MVTTRLAGSVLDAAHRLAVVDPGAVAVRCADQQLTRAQLHVRARVLAAALEPHLTAAGRDRVVGVLIERALDLPIAQLAAWYAGAAFLILDPALPPTRLRQMMESAAVAVVVCRPSDMQRVPAGLPVAVLDAADDLDLPSEAIEPGVYPVAGDDLAYVIHTSGTTGRPKTVAVTQTNVAAVCAGWALRYSLGPEDRVLQLASVGFDVAAGDFLRMALGGARLVLPTRDELVDPVTLVELMRREAISYLEITPSLLRALCAGLPHPSPVPSLRCLVVGGERFEVADVSAARRLLAANGRLFNSYGITETTIDTTSVELRREDRYSDGVPLGRPFAGTRLDVLDAGLATVKGEAAGEAYIGGDYVARGYLAAPAATAERFVPDPAGPPGARMFRTGDRMRHTRTGELVHLGRTDDQVKISGVRVDLAEIDRGLTALPTVAAAACVLTDDATTPRIVAHVVAVPGRQLTIDSIGDALRETLPAVMVPAAVVLHHQLPVSATGKIDRAALTAAKPAGAAGAMPRPGNTTSDRIAALMSSVLGAPVGRDDDFFRSGGSSLLATVLLGKIRADLRLALPNPSALWQDPTPRRLAASLVATDVDAPRPTGAGDTPLSPAQRGLWVAAQLHPQDSSTTVCVCLAIAGRPDVELLDCALHRLVARHPALRTVVHFDPAGEPISHVLPAWPGQLEVRSGPIDHSWLREPWNLEQGPTFRAVFTRTPDGGELTLAGSHLILDGESIRIILAELGELCRGGQLPPAPALTPAEVATWQAGRANSAGIAHWRAGLAGAPVPIPAPCRTRPNSVRIRHRRRVDVDTTRRLEELARGHGTSLFDVLLVGWLTVQRGWQGSDDLVVGVPFGDRWIPGTEATVGFLVDTVALRVDTDSSSGVSALLARVHDAITAARRYRDVPFTDVLHALGHSGSEARLFGSWFNYLGDADVAPDLPGVTVSITDPPVLGGLFDVNLYVERSAGELDLQLLAGPDGPDESHAAELLEQFGRALGTLAVGPAPQPESRAVPHRTHTPLPARSALAAQLAAGLARRGERPCVSDPRTSWNAPEVTTQTHAIAAQLQAMGIKPGQLVVVVGSRAAELVPAVVAVVESGAAFCVQDGTLPAAWRAAQLRIASPAAVLTIRPGNADGPLVELRREPELARQDCDYLQFTSGSTSTPQPVRSGYPQLLAALDNYQLEAQISEADRVAMLAGLGHDPLLRELFLPIMAAAEIVIPPPGFLRAPYELRSWLAHRGVTVAHVTPALLRAMCGAAGPVLPDLRLIVSSGDTLYPADVVAAAAAAPSATLVNGYGATETPQLPALAEIATDGLPDAGSVAVRDGPGEGRLLILRTGSDGPAPAEAEIGEIGEIVVESPALALGYGADHAPADRFRPGACPSCRRYATGDRGRRLADGSVEILGRVDDEVSIAAHRVSLSAVTALIRHEFAVRDVVALLVDGATADDAPRLATWIVPAAGTIITSVAVRRRLRRVAAPELVPNVVVILDDIPRDANGKADRRALTVPTADPGSEVAGTEGSGADTLADLVAAAYSEVLGVHPVPLNANFFDLGGSSLAMTRVLHRLETALSQPLSALTLFEFPSVAALTAKLTNQSYTRTTPRRPTSASATRDASRRASVRRAIRQGVSQ